jgi:hypothetical protein
VPPRETGTKDEQKIIKEACHRLNLVTLDAHIAERWNKLKE